MARGKSIYVCQECGGIHAKWAGRCDACGAWNTLVEETAAPPASGGTKRPSGRGDGIVFTELAGTTPPPPRRQSGIAEFDRACGGGLVAGSAVLVGGDPGIGKSTVLLQVCAALARSGAACAYISGEEAVEQIRMRADRLGLSDAPVALATATDVDAIVSALDRAGRPDVVVVDSIQTMYLANLESAPGTVAQVRACAQALIRHAKRRGLTLILVGHVTKEGQIAGPRVLEHMVDTVLYFEGERGHQFRILRAVKNRFGASEEIGVFEMTDRGLMEVANPSALFIGDRATAVSGAAVFAGLEGTRPVLVEIQALVAPSSMATPRRAVVGWDGARLAMVLAVLEARCGIAFSGRDVYLSVAGGLRISEPAADLAAAAALLSSLADVALPAETVILGEIGLSGEIRPVSQTDVRLGEAAKLGFTAAWTPPARGRRAERGTGALKPTVMEHVTDLAATISLDFRADSR
ncbi:MAG: DNA repair protein RadA [Alphaproteobacteria bacterium]